MAKIEFTGKVDAKHMFFMDVPDQDKTLRGAWLAQVEVAHSGGEMVCIIDGSTLTGLAEGKTKEEAIEKAEQYLSRVGL